MKTKELSDHLLTIAKLKACAQDAVFSIRAFEYAAHQIDMYFGEEVAADDSFDNISGIGKNIKQVIQQYLTTNSSQYYKDLALRYPTKCLELTRVDGIGPRTALKLYQYGIHSFDHLLKLAKEKKLDSVLTERLRQKILIAGEISEGRQPYVPVKMVAQGLKEELEKAPGIQEVIIAGSLRRELPTIGDMDLVCRVAPDANRQDILKVFATLGKNFEGGEHKASTQVPFGKTYIKCDLWLSPPDGWGALVGYATGSKDFNIKLRALAKSKDLHISEQGIFELNTDGSVGKQVGGSKEEDLFTILNLPWVEPKNRLKELPQCLPK